MGLSLSVTFPTSLLTFKWICNLSVYMSGMCERSELGKQRDLGLRVSRELIPEGHPDLGFRVCLRLPQKGSGAAIDGVTAKWCSPASAGTAIEVHSAENGGTPRVRGDCYRRVRACRNPPGSEGGDREPGKRSCDGGGRETPSERPAHLCCGSCSPFFCLFFISLWLFLGSCACVCSLLRALTGKLSRCYGFCS